MAAREVALSSVAALWLEARKTMLAADQQPAPLEVPCKGAESRRHICTVCAAVLRGYSGSLAQRVSMHSYASAGLGLAVRSRVVRRGELPRSAIGGKSSGGGRLAEAAES
jgi:hypothetical protein